MIGDDEVAQTDALIASADAEIAEAEAAVVGPQPFTPVMRPGANGRGKLKVGGNWGNKGGTAPIAHRIKQLAQLALLPRVRILGEIADGASFRLEGDERLTLSPPTATERVRALEALHKIGMGDTVTISDLRQRLESQLQMIRSRTEWDTDELVEALRVVWS